jgi:hypothetical protein
MEHKVLSLKAEIRNLKSQERTIKRFTLTIVLLFAISTYAAPGVTFLEVPVGARENALGGAGVALISGPTSATYNPASAAFTTRGVALMHHKQFADTRSEFIGFTVRRGDWAISPSFWGTRVSDIEYRLEPTSEPISTFDATNEAVGAAVAYAVNSQVSVGVAGRYIHQKILFESSQGWTVDAGVIGRWLERRITLGLAVNHAGKMSEFVAERPTLPTTLRGGAAYEKVFGKTVTALVTADALAIRDSAPQYRGGVELRAPTYLAVRAGMVQGLEAQTFSLGFGLFVKHIQFDYAFIPYRENLGEGHRFSLSFDL